MNKLWRRLRDRFLQFLSSSLGLGPDRDQSLINHARGFMAFWVFACVALFVEELGWADCGRIRDLSMVIAILLCVWAFLSRSGFWLVWWLAFLTFCLVAGIAGFRCEDFEPVFPLFLLLGFIRAFWTLRSGPHMPIAAIFTIFAVAYLLKYLIWDELDMLERSLFAIISIAGPPAVFILTKLGEALDAYHQRGLEYES